MKFIIGTGDERKLYDTDKATLLAEKKSKNLKAWTTLYVSNKGNYYVLNKQGISKIKVVPMSKEDAKNHVLKEYGVDKFVEIFGQVEEA